jgi:hypothetical protein
MLIIRDVWYNITTFLEIPELSKARQLSKMHNEIIQNYTYDFSNQQIFFLYTSIYHKKFFLFLWLQKNNIDPNFERSKNIIAFSIMYSNYSIINWLLDNNAPIRYDKPIEMNAIIKKNNLELLQLFDRNLKKRIKNGEKKYVKQYIQLNDYVDSLK